tara:strand:+ start:2198 stop:2368 length:171 start_codon:yes stop_codon:yes gene_type:complete
MKHLLPGAILGCALLFGACASPDRDSVSDGDVRADVQADVQEARLPEIRYYMIADA